MLLRKLIAEALGTALLLATVVGSGIMGEQLAGGNVAIALLANTLATGAGLVALILTFGPISGAHFNPAVTLADASQGGLPLARGPWLPARAVRRCLRRRGGRARHVQGAGAFLRFAACAFGHVATGQRVRRDLRPALGHLGLRPATAARRPVRGRRVHHGRSTGSRRRPRSQTRRSRRARAASDTFAGIRPADAPGFIVAQLLGAAASTALFRWLVPTLPRYAERVVARGPRPSRMRANAKRSREAPRRHRGERRGDQRRAACARLRVRLIFVEKEVPMKA